MSYHVLYEACPWHSRAALFDEHGRLLTLRIDDVDRPFREGAIVLGRIRAVEGSLGGAFVDIGDRTDGFLPFTTLMPEQRDSKLTQGQSLLVRISRAGYLDKGARLDARVSLKNPPNKLTPPALVQAAPSALTRAFHDAGSQPVKGWVPNGALRPTMAKHLAEANIGQVDADGDDSWYTRLDTELDTMLTPQPSWPMSGGNLIVEMTSAVATIDVNAGPSVSLTRSETVLAANLAAATEVARLARLLDLGGVIIVDFITPPVRGHRHIISEHLEAALSTTDENFVSLRPMSRHGIVEITRERSGPSLTLLMQRPYVVAGRILLELWRTPAGSLPRVRGRRIRCHPDVASLLKQRLTSEACLTHLGMLVAIEADPLLPVSRYTIADE
ncbi:MAG: ribonuclease E/G [Pseudomonadaceae bacterium]|nr:ribonuclease E/G [Pseudomonadaceae bacterium]